MLPQVLLDLGVEHLPDLIRISLVVKLRPHHRCHFMGVILMSIELEAWSLVLINHLLYQGISLSYGLTIKHFLCLADESGLVRA